MRWNSLLFKYISLGGGGFVYDHSCQNRSQEKFALHKSFNIEICFFFFLISGEFTFGATKSHDQRAIALVQLPEAGAASSVSDDGQLSQDECLCNIKYKHLL